MDGKRPRDDSTRDVGVAAGVAVLAVICCAALPSLAWLAGSVTLGVVLGVGAAIVATAVLAAGIAIRVWRRRRSAARWGANDN